jgi:AraC-like DNA-binding protein
LAEAGFSEETDKEKKLMRKQLRILLFAALVAVLVVMTALVISADYTVTDKDGAPVGENEGVYATLADAVKAVTDGGTITVNGDVSDVATDLSKEGVSYTIKGGSTEGMNTLTITSAKFGGQTTLLYLSKGSVTLENVAIAGDASGGAVFHVYDEVGTMPSLTVNNVKVTATSAHAFWLRIACVLTIKGENTEIAGGTMTVMSLQNALHAALYGYKKYILLVRLKEAEKMILGTNKSIKEIASLCGFNDSNRLSTLFKEVYGLPPMQYKKEVSYNVHH